MKNLKSRLNFFIWKITKLICLDKKDKPYLEYQLWVIVLSVI